MMDNEQLPKGYKNTEVGVIPSDWEVAQLKGLTTLITDGAHLSPPTEKNGYPIATVENINKGYIDLDSCRVISSKDYQYLVRNNCKPIIGDVLLSKDGTIGITFSIKKEEDVVLLSSIAIIRPQKEKLDSIFLSKSFSSEWFYLFLDRVKAGSALTRIVLRDIKKYIFPLPPTKTEQTAIATALSDADALINSLEKLIAKKRNIKQGAMQQLLKPKEGWEVKKLGDFLDYEQPTEYLVTDTEYNDNNQIPVLTAGKTFILGYTNEEHGIFKNLPVIIFDDFTTAIKYVDFPFKAKSSAMKMLLPKNEKVNLRFIYEIMLQIKYQVADHKRHWIGEYSKIEIKVPSTSEEQNEIATILSDMDADIQALETKLEKYRKIKLGMMQNLLTGKIRLV
jgi:type I restriction enzyme, S subunit